MLKKRTPTNLHKVSRDFNITAGSEQLVSLLKQESGSNVNFEKTTDPSLFEACINYKGNDLSLYLFQLLSILTDVSVQNKIEAGILDTPKIDIKGTPYKLIWLKKDGRDIPVISAGKHVVNLLGIDEEIEAIKRTMLKDIHQGPNAIMNLLASFAHKPSSSLNLKPGGLYIPGYSETYIKQCEDPNPSNSWENFQNNITGDFEKFTIDRYSFADGSNPLSSSNQDPLYKKIDCSILPKESKAALEDIEYKYDPTGLNGKGLILVSNKQYAKYAEKLFSQGMSPEQIDQEFRAAMDIAQFSLRTDWE